MSRLAVSLLTTTTTAAAAYTKDSLQGIALAFRYFANKGGNIAPKDQCRARTCPRKPTGSASQVWPAAVPRLRRPGQRTQQISRRSSECES